MRVILLRDIKNLGKKNEVKEVSDGYGRNFLLKQNLAKIATSGEVSSLEKQKEAERMKEKEEVEKEKQAMKQINATSFDMKMKVGKKEELFESVNAEKIAEKIADAGFDSIKSEQIDLQDPIKKLGEYPIKIKFKHAPEAEITVKIIKED